MEIELKINSEKNQTCKHEKWLKITQKFDESFPKINSFSSSHFLTIITYVGSHKLASCDVDDSAKHGND